MDTTLLAQWKVPLYWLGVGLFLGLEQQRAYRPPAVSRPRRWATNFSLTVLNGICYQLLFASLIAGLLSWVELRRLGVLHLLELPAWLRVGLGVIFLDFSLYLWHLLTHTVPVLWRFHRVHHSDLEMDVSTASRFHLGEFLVSGLVRIQVIYLFGISLTAYLLFEVLVNLSIQFHHSSIRVNPAFERLWALLFVPPFLHRIHHSVRIRERDANYGVIFSLWDRLLGTLVTGVEQEKIVIGIGSHRDFSRLGFLDLLIMPFTRRTL